MEKGCEQGDELVCVVTDFDLIFQIIIIQHKKL